MPLDTAVRQLSFATSVAAALSISACGPQPRAQANRVCTDAAGTRINDANCRRTGGAGGGAHWYYGGSGRQTAEGARVKGGSYAAPRGGFGRTAFGSAGG